MRHSRNSYNNNDAEEGMSGIKKNNKSILICVIVSIVSLLFFINKYHVAEKPTNFKIVYLIILFSILIEIFFVSKEVQKKEYKIEKIFIMSAIPLGIIYMLLIPPGLVPDEWVHMHNTFSLSSQVMGLEINNKVTMRDNEIELYNKQITVPNNDYYDYVYSNIFSISNNNDYNSINIESPNKLSIFGYFPGVIGVTVARLLNLSAVTTFYLGRLCNFIFYLMLSYCAIKKIPFGKLLLFTITMLPMTCHQMCSLSYDTVINSSTFFATAYGMFFVYQSSNVMIDDIIYYALCSVLLIANKGSTYAFILTIPILARYFNPNGEKIAKKTKIIIFLIIIIAILLLNYRSLVNNQTTGIESVSGAGIVPWAGVPSYTLNELIINVLTTINLFVNTFIQRGGYYIYTAIGSLMGWLSIPIPNWIINSWIVILIIVPFAEKSNNEVFTHEHKILYFFIAVTIILLVMLAMALAWTPSGYSTIEGVQGRYFIPIIFLLLICFQNSKLYMNERITKVVLMIIVILPILTIGNLILLVL